MPVLLLDCPGNEVTDQLTLGCHLVALCEAEVLIDLLLQTMQTRCLAAYICFV